MTPVVLHLSPHPDDELIGAPATLMALRDAGWRVVNLACGLGSGGDLRQRERELRGACAAARFELLLPEDDLRRQIAAALAELRPAVVVSPGPHERHPAHERVAGLAREALEQGGAEARWWTWAVWGWLERPNLATAFDRPRLDEILAALGAHRSQLERNDYRRLVAGRAEANACLAPELLHGFGSKAAPGLELAELLSERILLGDRWTPGTPRWLDPASEPGTPG